MYFVGYIGYAYVLLQQRLNVCQSGCIDFWEQDVRFLLLRIFTNIVEFFILLFQPNRCVYRNVKQKYFNLNTLKIDGTFMIIVFVMIICHMNILLFEVLRLALFLLYCVSFFILCVMSIESSVMELAQTDAQERTIKVSGIQRAARQFENLPWQKFLYHTHWQTLKNRKVSC